MTRDILIFVTDLISFVKSCKMLCLSPLFKVWIIFLIENTDVVIIDWLNYTDWINRISATRERQMYTAIFRVIDLCWEVALSQDANTVLTIAVILSDGYTAVALYDLQLCWLQAHRDPSGRSGRLTLSFFWQGLNPALVVRDFYIIFDWLSNLLH